jgi:transposase-like protein
MTGDRAEKYYRDYCPRCKSKHRELRKTSDGDTMFYCLDCDFTYMYEQVKSPPKYYPGYGGGKE